MAKPNIQRAAVSFVLTIGAIYKVSLSKHFVLEWSRVDWTGVK